MTSSADIEDFIALCERSNFRSRDEILDGLRGEEYELTRYEGKAVPARSMFEVYSIRSRHVGELAVDSLHAQRLVGDIDAYVRELECAMDDEIRLWRVSVDQISDYAIFEGANSKRILGCIYGIDRRLVSEEDWDKLWGHSSE